MLKVELEITPTDWENLLYYSSLLDSSDNYEAMKYLAYKLKEMIDKCTKKKS